LFGFRSATYLSFSPFAKAKKDHEIKSVEGIAKDFANIFNTLRT